MAPADPEEQTKDQDGEDAVAVQDTGAGQYRVLSSSLPISTRPADTSDTPVKRGRGRPKGSKNKKAVPTPAGESSSAPPRKRGRPPKEKKDDDTKDDADDDDGDDEPTPKRKRGRPPKPAAPADPNAEPKKRGRPPKKVEKPAGDEA
ncbi:hypothetical protein B0H13DRAFT_1849903 [Mycena leptocephala]|nr:hypothetical protein B0H13DRAFT_1849903 [Mycena leptocephala]